LGTRTTTSNETFTMQEKISNNLTMSGLEEIRDGNLMLDPVTAIDRLRKQNEKLRNELRVLSKALDEALDKQKKQERQRARAHTLEKPSNETERELEVTFNKINKYKREIASMKKQLDGNLNESKITDLENQSTYLNKRIQELESENKALQKIEKEQNKALMNFESAGHPEKLSSLKEEIRSLKDTYKELVTKQKEDEKVLKEKHEKCVDLEEKCRKLKSLVKQKKQEEDEPKPPEVTEQDILELENKIKETEQKKKEEEARLKKRVRDLETQIRDSKHNIEQLNIKLKEKDQECRLSMLKIKELRRAVRHNQLKPLPKQGSRHHDSKFTNMSQGGSDSRHSKDSLYRKHQEAGSKSPSSQGEDFELKVGEDTPTSKGVFTTQERNSPNIRDEFKYP